MSEIQNIHKFIRRNIGWIRKIYEDSKRVNRELGFPICLEDSNIVSGEICFGMRESVTVKRCESGRIIGELHTHPYNLSNISPKDIYILFAKDYEVMCIAGEDGVSCYHIYENNISSDLKKAVKKNYEDTVQLNEEIAKYNQELYEKGVKGINLRTKAKLEQQRLKLLRNKTVLYGIFFFLRNDITVQNFQLSWDSRIIPPFI